MGSIARYEPPSESSGLESVAQRERLPARLRRVPRLWDGEYSASSTEFEAPTWESLPAEVRWKVSGADVASGPTLGSFVIPSTVVRRGTDYFETTSGWLLHEFGVFVLAATRPLRPARGTAYRPAGEWSVDHECVVGPAFRLKRGQFSPDTEEVGTDQRGVPPRFEELWQSIPERPRKLLATNAPGECSVEDQASWWVIGDNHQVRMWLCYQRRSATGLRAATQSRAVRTAAGSDPAVTANDLAHGSWDVSVFSAALDSAFMLALGRSSPSLPAADGR